MYFDSRMLADFIFATLTISMPTKNNVSAYSILSSLQKNAFAAGAFAQHWFWSASRYYQCDFVIQNDLRALTYGHAEIRLFLFCNLHHLVVDLLATNWSDRRDRRSQVIYANQHITDTIAQQHSLRFQRHQNQLSPLIVLAAKISWRQQTIAALPTTELSTWLPPVGEPNNRMTAPLLNNWSRSLCHYWRSA